MIGWSGRGRERVEVSISSQQIDWSGGGEETPTAWKSTQRWTREEEVYAICWVWKIGTSREKPVRNNNQGGHGYMISSSDWLHSAATLCGATDSGTEIHL